MDEKAVRRVAREEVIACLEALAVEFAPHKPIGLVDKTLRDVAEGFRTTISDVEES